MAVRPVKGVKVIATHTKPDVDALVAVWLAKRSTQRILIYHLRFE